MAPVVHELKSSDKVDVKILVTAQHRQMLDQMMEIFDIRTDWDLNIMIPDQSVAEVTSCVLTKINQVIQNQGKPDCILVQGDTTTVMATALVCYYNDIRLGHVEAGLRSGNIRTPFPEEANRRIVALLGDYHFAPTASAASNLKNEKVAENRIYVTGNTVIDALYYIIDRYGLNEDAKAIEPFVLVTCHRRESFGAPIRNIFSALRNFAERHPEVTIRYPVHPNPNVMNPAREILGNTRNIKLQKPLNYVEFVQAMRQAIFIISDSGGIQEEATALGKKVLVLREVTERPEGIETGFCQLVGMDRDRILDAAEKCLRDPSAPAKRDVYGDGKAAKRIVGILEKELLIR